MQGITYLRNNLSLLKIKLCSYLLFKQYSKLEQSGITSLEEVFKATDTNHFDSMKLAFLNLVSVPLKWSNYNNDERVGNEYVPILSYCNFEPEKITYKFSSIFSKKITTTEDYKKFNMHIQNQFTSAYAKMIYSLCLNNLDSSKELQK